MVKTESFEKVEIQSTTDLNEWLLKHHEQEASVWLVTFKKSETGKYVSVQEVLDELLCFGWIDGIRRKLDDKQTMQLISPRKTQHWAKTYKDRVSKLIKEGRMHDAGLKSIQESKKNGLWNFMDDVDQLIYPKDLVSAFENHETAQQFFDQINDSSKRFALRWLTLAKTETTRKKRIIQLVELSKNGEKLPGS